MKLLLTSAGIKNPSIHDALVELLGKPIAECDALCIPTALYGHPHAGPVRPGASSAGRRPAPRRCGAGLEVDGRPGAHRPAEPRRRAAGSRWVRETDVLLVERRRCDVPVPLDAAERAGGPPGDAARDGLGRGERREHGDDPPDR